MSRLADILMGMDERRASRPGLGGIAHLGESAEPRRQWRIVGTFAIVVLMGILTAAVVLRPQPHASRPAQAALRAPVAATAPTTPAEPPAAPQAAPSSERFASLMSDGQESAQSGDFDKAALAFRRAAELKPGEALAWNNLGVVLTRAGEETRAFEAFQQALKAAPGDPEAHRNLAVALDRRGRAAEAVRHYRAFVSKSAGDTPERAQVLARLEELGARRSGE